MEKNKKTMYQLWNGCDSMWIRKVMLFMKNHYYRCQKTKILNHMSIFFTFLPTFNNTISYPYPFFLFLSKHWFTTLKVFKINKYIYRYIYIDAIPDNSNPQNIPLVYHIFLLHGRDDIEVMLWNISFPFSYSQCSINRPLFLYLFFTWRTHCFNLYLSTGEIF